MGKALALDTPLPTPAGWTTMGEVRSATNSSGRTATPPGGAATEVMVGRPCYEVHVLRRTVIVADGEHQWLTETRASRGPPSRRGRVRRSATSGPSPVRTTGEIAALCARPRPRRLNHSVRTRGAFSCPRAVLPVPPYVLGAWLGDGTSAAAQITSADPEIVMRLEAEGLVVKPVAARLRYSLSLPDEPVAAGRVSSAATEFVPRTSGQDLRKVVRRQGEGSRRTRAHPTCPDCGEPSSGVRRCQVCRDEHGTVTAMLRGLGVLGDKHIPQAYLRASARPSVVICWPGCSTPTAPWPMPAAVQFTVTNRVWRRAFVNSWSAWATGATRRDACGQGRARVESSTAYIVNFTGDDDVFWLERKELACTRSFDVKRSPRRVVALHHRRAGDRRRCRSAASRCDTRTTSTWPATRWCRRTTPRSASTSSGLLRSSTRWLPSSSRSR